MLPVASNNTYRTHQRCRQEAHIVELKAVGGVGGPVQDDSAVGGPGEAGGDEGRVGDGHGCGLGVSAVLRVDVAAQV